MMRVTSSSVFELLLWPIEHRIPEFSNRANPRAGDDEDGRRSHNGRREPARIFKSNYDSDRACRVANPQINQNIVALLPAIHETMTFFIQPFQFPISEFTVGDLNLLGDTTYAKVF